jgi:hypothetical protein
MAIIVGHSVGGGSINPSEAFIFKKDFTAVDRTSAESDRDAHYLANPSELIELDANPNWFITLTFQDLGVSTVVAQVRRSGVWATLGGSSGVDFSNMTDGEVAIYDQTTGKLIGRDVFIDEAGSLVVGTNSLSLGQIHTMSSGYENVMFSNGVTGSIFHPTWQNATIGADETPTARMYTSSLQPKVVVPENGDDKTGSVSTPDYTGSSSVNERLFSVYVEAVASITNVVANIIDVASGEKVYRVDLGDLVADVETKVDFKVPIDVKVGVSNRIEIRSDDGIVTLKADTTNTYPWIAFDVQPWEDRPVALIEDVIVVSDDTLTGDGTTASPLSVDKDEVNNIDDIDASFLTGASDTTLHFHDSDRDRNNHTGTQLSNTISDFESAVVSNSAVTLNTAKVSADGSVTTHSDVSSSGSGAIITSSERQSIENLTPVLNSTDFIASQNGYYYVDTSVVGSVVVTVPSVVTEFIIADSNSTWTNTAYVDVVVGVDTVRLKFPNRNKYYQFIRFGDIFFVYDGQGEFKATGSVV